MMGFGLLVILLFVGLVAYGLGWRPAGLANPGTRTGSPWAGKPRESALDILKERYARGEISREEFEAMRQDLTE